MNIEIILAIAVIAFVLFIAVISFIAGIRRKSFDKWRLKKTVEGVYGKENANE